MNTRNNFGVLGSSYDSARRGYPQEVYDYLKSFTKVSNPRTLDIGCGTGLATRELQKNGFEVIGLDKDEIMIETAKKYGKDIPYSVAKAEQLPFEGDTFDIVTAFTAFHWFTHKKAVNEIKRVLKDGGIFFAALKDNRYDNEHAKAQQQDYQTILRKYVGDKYNSANNYNPEKILAECGFKNLTEEEFPVDEYYSIEDALVLIQSLSYWNLVAEDKRQVMLEELRQMYSNYLVDGKVIRYREISTMIGFK